MQGFLHRDLNPRRHACACEVLVTFRALPLSSFSCCFEVTKCKDFEVQAIRESSGAPEPQHTLRQCHGTSLDRTGLRGYSFGSIRVYLRSCTPGIGCHGCIGSSMLVPRVVREGDQKGVLCFYLFCSSLRALYPSSLVSHAAPSCQPHLTPERGHGMPISPPPSTACHPSAQHCPW